MNVIVIIALATGVALLLVAYFSGIEVAFITANRLNIELKKKRGASSGILLSNLFDNPSRFFGTNIIGFILFLVITVLLVNVLLEFLVSLIISKVALSYLVALKIFADILVSWLLIITLGRFIPRAIFKAKSDSLLSAAARTRLLGLFDRLFHNVATAFIKLSAFILDVIFDMRIDKKKETFSRLDPDHFFQQNNEFSEGGGELNTELVENALSLAKVKVRECLVPRKEIVGVDISMTVEEVRKTFVETKLSKLVVFDGTIDHINGYIHQLDLFKKPSGIKDMLLRIPAVPESMSATDLITKLSKERKSMAWVVDEFGGTAGVVTMEDLLEEIFGEIKDEYDVEEFEEKKVSEEEYIFSGRLELDYLNDKYGMEFPQNDSETLSGYIIHQHETIPRLKERIIIGDYEFEVLNVSDTRIEMVRLKILK